MMQRSVRRLSFVIASLAFLMVIGTGTSPAQAPAAVHGVRVSTRTFVDAKGIVRHHTVVTIANMAPPDGAHDVSYLVTNRGVTRTMYAAGTLSAELGVSGGHELALDAGYTYSYNRSIIFDTCDEPC